MKLYKAIENLGEVASKALAEKAAQELNIPWTEGISVVFGAIAGDLSRVPRNIGGKNDTELQAIKKWVSKYKTGQDGRASQRISKVIGTTSDPIIEELIGSRIKKLTKDDLEKITYAHRLGMSAENILGLILEEYLADNLHEYGWHCAWGETVKSVDFVHKDGRLLQIKNRSNSENSSSSAIREGTEIEKWFRIKANKIEYMWESLNEICGTNVLSEEAFISFVRETMTNNPNCLAIEQGNPWDS